MGEPLVGRTEVVERCRGLLFEGGAGGVLVAGPAGVGRSRIIEELASIVESKGLNVHRCTATDASRSLPFEALARAIPDAVAAGHQISARWLVQTFRSHAEVAPVMVTVDDAHLLDDGSIAVVEELIEAEDVLVALTMRTERVDSQRLTSLWKDNGVERVELGLLDRYSADLVAESLLGGAMSATMSQDLWDLTLGSPRMISAVVEAAGRTGALECTAEFWEWSGTPASDPKIVALVADLTSQLTAAARDVVDVLAVGAPLPVAVASHVTALEAIAEAESVGLIESLADGDEIRLRHPLHAAVALAALGPVRQELIATRLADGWSASDRADSSVRGAHWLLATGHRPSTDVCVAAAREALTHFDLDIAAQLAQAAIAEDDGWAEPHRVLAEILRFQKRGVDAAAAYAAAAVRATDDEARAAIALARAENESLLLDRKDAAREILRSALDDVTDPVAVRSLAVGLTFQASLTGDLDDVVEVGPVALRLTTEPDTELAITNLTVFAQAMTLQTIGAEGIAARGLHLAEDRRAELPLGPQQLGVSLVLVLVGDARFDEAFGLAADGTAKARLSGEPTSLWSVGRAFAACCTGDLDEAADAALESIVSLDELDPLGFLATAAGLGAVAALQAGRIPQAERLARRASESGREIGALAISFILRRYEAWLAARTGDLGAATALAASAGRDAVAASHRLWGTMALHDTVRFGGVALVLDDLEDLSKTCDAGLVALARSQAMAVTASDVVGLERVADRFSEAGSRIFAAEAFAQAAALAATHGDVAGSCRAASRAMLVWQSCSGAATPALVACPEALSERELEIASLAATGITSREIGEQLFVSTRTVDNHLRSSYRKLEVSCREELSSTLAIVGDHA